jgi:hypothetical protein
MKPKSTNHFSENPETPRLSKILNPRHELYFLAEMIEWEEFEEAFGALYSEGNSRPLMSGHLVLIRMDLSSIMF